MPVWAAEPLGDSQQERAVARAELDNVGAAGVARRASARVTMPV